MIHTERAVSNFLDRTGKLLIGGEWKDATFERTFDVYNPATEEVIAKVARGSDEDVNHAVRAARTAFEGEWSSLSPAERGHLIYRLADAIDGHADELALIETLDNGKPLSASRWADVPVAVERLRYYSGWATKLEGASHTVSLPGDWHTYTLREPVGVVGLIVPWNFPLTSAIAKIAPALAAGCTLILKPAEETPLSALRVGELAQQVGFPVGVINIITGFGDAGAALVRHPGVDKISFTGSTAVGREIVRASAGNLKRLTLELGGKSPSIVFPDANLEQAIAGVARNIFANAGQVCTAGSRLYAHQDVFDRVIEGVAHKASALKVGSGIDTDTDMGPLVSSQHLERVMGYIDAGRKDGATVVTGGDRLPKRGYFIAPTILANAKKEAKVWQEEIFGPVLCVTRFDNDALEAVAREANDTEFGLMAYVWTQNLGIAHKMARLLKSGTVRINGGAMDSSVPFGGYKQSGWGRENGYEGLVAFTEVKSVMVAL